VARIATSGGHFATQQGWVDRSEKRHEAGITLSQAQP
jgi:hypothetical protein